MKTITDIQKIAAAKFPDLSPEIKRHPYSIVNLKSLILAGEVLLSIEERPVRTPTGQRPVPHYVVETPIVIPPVGRFPEERDSDEVFASTDYREALRVAAELAREVVCEQ